MLMEEIRLTTPKCIKNSVNNGIWIYHINWWVKTGFLVLHPQRTGSKLKNQNPENPQLVGGWTNPFEKYACQFGSFPQIGLKIQIFETTT